MTSFDDVPTSAEEPIETYRFLTRSVRVLFNSSAISSSTSSASEQGFELTNDLHLPFNKVAMRKTTNDSTEKYSLLNQKHFPVYCYILAQVSLASLISSMVPKNVQRSWFRAMIA